MILFFINIRELNNIGCIVPRLLLIFDEHDDSQVLPGSPNNEQEFFSNFLEYQVVAIGSRHNDDGEVQEDASPRDTEIKNIRTCLEVLAAPSQLDFEYDVNADDDVYDQFYEYE